MTSCFVAFRVRLANRDIPRAEDGSLPGMLAGGRMAPRTLRTGRLQSARRERELD